MNNPMLKPSDCEINDTLLAVTLVLLLWCPVSSPGSSELTSESCTIMHLHTPPPHHLANSTSVNTQSLTGPLLATRYTMHVQSHCRVTFTAFTISGGVLKFPVKCTSPCHILEACLHSLQKTDWAGNESNDSCLQKWEMYYLIENVIMDFHLQSFKSNKQRCQRIWFSSCSTKYFVWSLTKHKLDRGGSFPNRLFGRWVHFSSRKQQSV